MTLTPPPDPAHRYARQLILDGWRSAGQSFIGKARVFALGAGGLGSAALPYLVGAGIGALTVADSDPVETANLHRQVAYTEDDVDRDKAEAMAARLARLNPTVMVRAFAHRVGAENLPPLLERVDLVLDCSDNFPTRYLLADACWRAGIPLVNGSVVAWQGYVLSLVPQVGNPCYRCLMPEPPPAGEVGSARTVGVFGPAVGVVGTLQASEALKLLSGGKETLERAMIRYDAARHRFHRLERKPDPDCPFCGGG